jgi:hypothetical protein
MSVLFWRANCLLSGVADRSGVRLPRQQLAIFRSRSPPFEAKDPQSFWRKINKTRFAHLLVLKGEWSLHS